MTAQLAPTPIQKFFDNNGNPLFNGKLYSYVAGTSIPQATYTDSTMSTQNTNPVILNARGEANVWLDTTLSYKLVLQEANGTQIWVVDNIPGNGVFGTVQNIAALRNVTGVGVSNYQAIIVDGYTTAGDGGGGTFWWNSSSTTADNGGTIIAPTGVSTGRWYRIYSGALSAKAFGATGNGTTDDTANLNKWLAIGGALYAPTGTYKYTSTLTPISNSNIYGDGTGTLFQGAANVIGFTLTGLSNVKVHDIAIDGASATYTSNNNDGIHVDWTTASGSNIEIANNRVTNVSGAAIIALSASSYASTNLIIEDNYISGCGAHGIISQDYISDVFISNNYVANTALGTADRPGISASRSGSNVTITDNIVIGSASALGSSNHGISIDTTDYCTCTNNVVYGWLGYGIEIAYSNNSAITGNQVSSCSGGGIVLSGSQSTSPYINTNVTISGNAVTNCTDSTGQIYSFITSGTGTVQHTGITVTGNICNGGTAGSGIQMGLCNYLTVTGNTCCNNYLSGIYILDCTNFNVAGNTVVNNNCTSIETITSITESGSTATVTCTSHGYSTGEVATIWGAVPPQYSGTWTITVVDANTFTYTTVSGLTTPAVGSIYCSLYNSASHGGIRVQYSVITTKGLQIWNLGSNIVYGNAYRDIYDVSVYGPVGFMNNALILKETNSPRVENLTSGIASNIEDRVAVYMINGKIVFAYNNAGTINYLVGTLDGSTATWTNSSTTP